MMNRVQYVLQKRYLTKPFQLNNPKKYITLSGTPPNDNCDAIILWTGLFLYYIYKKTQ